MTELLYQTDSYLREFDATVTVVEGNAVALDRTAFYPGGGGQPNDVGTLIAEAEKNPSGIVAASRWIKGGAFHGYSKVKLICNWIFQHFFSFLYGTRLSDMTYGYRILPTRLVQAIRWEELRHPFYLETVVKPLRLGVPVTEIPSVWYARIEGESQTSFFRSFAYFRIGLKTRFASKRSILKSDLAGRQ